MRNTTRLVHVSTTGAFQARRLKPSDPVSTCFGELSARRVDILSRAKIAVMVLAALWTIPLSNVEREAVQNVPTAVAPLRGGEEAVHNPQLPAVSLTLVSDHLTEHPERSIGYCLGQWAAFDHAADVKVLDADAVVAPNQIGGHFIQVVLSGVSNVLLYPGHADALPVPPTTTLDATRENPLCPSKSSLVFARVLRVGDSLSIAGSGQAVDSQVNANRFPGRFKLGKLFVQDQRYEVTSAGSFGDCDGRWIRLELATPIHIEPAQPADNQIRVVGVGPGELECGSRVFGALLVPFSFESRVGSLLVEKLHEGVVQVPQSLLDGDARDFPQPRCFFFTLPLGQLGGSLVVTNPLLSELPSVGPIPQCPIVGIPTTSEDLGKLGLLGLGWRKPESVSNLHANNIILVKAYFNRKLRSEGAISPPPKVGGLLAQLS